MIDLKTIVTRLNTRKVNHRKDCMLIISQMFTRQYDPQRMLNDNAKCKTKFTNIISIL